MCELWRGNGIRGFGGDCIGELSALRSGHLLRRGGVGLHGLRGGHLRCWLGGLGVVRGVRPRRLLWARGLGLRLLRCGGLPGGDGGDELRGVRHRRLPGMMHHPPVPTFFDSIPYLSCILAWWEGRYLSA